MNKFRKRWSTSEWRKWKCKTLSSRLRRLYIRFWCSSLVQVLFERDDLCWDSQPTVNRCLSPTILSAPKRIWWMGFSWEEIEFFIFSRLKVAEGLVKIMDKNIVAIQSQWMRDILFPGLAMPSVSSMVLLQRSWAWWIPLIIAANGVRQVDVDTFVG